MEQLDKGIIICKETGEKELWVPPKSEMDRWLRIEINRDSADDLEIPNGTLVSFEDLGKSIYLDHDYNKPEVTLPTDQLLIGHIGKCNHNKFGLILGRRLQGNEPIWIGINIFTGGQWSSKNPAIAPITFSAYMDIQPKLDISSLDFGDSDLDG